MVSPGTELAALNGLHSRSSAPDPPRWLRFPSVPGYLVCGEVADRGVAVEDHQVGDRVVGEGPEVWNSHSSHLVMDADAGNVIRIPDGVTFEEAVTTKLGSIAMTAVRILRPELGDSVAVMGAGPVGQTAARLCLVAGAGKVVAVDPLARRRDIAAKVQGISAVGPDELPSSLPPDPVSKLAGFDHVIEATGRPEGFRQACEAARVRGKIAVLSSTHEPVTVRLYDNIHSKGLQVFGAHGFVLPSEPDINDKWTDGRQRRLFLQLLAERRIEMRSLFTHRAHYTKAPGMYRGLQESPDEYLGVLFYWD